MTPPSTRHFVLAALCTTLLSLISPVCAYPHGKTIHVTYPQSIQAAIDSASGGDKVVVGAGTYHEQLTISKNGITLIGQGAILEPPSTFTKNNCTGLAGRAADTKSGLDTEAGICIQGSGIVFVKDETFNGEHYHVASVAQRVKDTTVSGFTVSGFSGLNIAILGAQDAIISENTVSSGPQYGILTVFSKNSNIKHNIVLPSGFIGICMDDVSSVTVQHNDISGYYIGLCVQTAGADLHDNTVHDSCIGAYVDPGVKGASLHDNVFKNTPAACNPNYGVGGVILAGSINTIVRNNTFSGLKNGGQSNGISIANDFYSGVPTTGSDVQRNTFTDNDLDVSLTTTGTGNVVKNNVCSSSNPPGLCAK